jgi:hypothetical protein
VISAYASSTHVTKAMSGKGTAHAGSVEKGDYGPATVVDLSPAAQDAVKADPQVEKGA